MSREFWVCVEVIVLIVASVGIAIGIRKLSAPRPAHKLAGLLSVSNQTHYELFVGCTNHKKDAYIIKPNDDITIKVACDGTGAEEVTEGIE